MGSRDSLAKIALKFQNCFAAIPMGGLSYEILANKHQCPQTYEFCPIRLNYQPNGFDFGGVEFDVHPFESGSHKRLYQLDFIVRMNKRNSLIIARYSKNFHTRATIKQIVNRWVEIIKNEVRVSP